MKQNEVRLNKIKKVSPISKMEDTYKRQGTENCSFEETVCVDPC